MVRTLLIIIGLFAIAAGFVWLKDTPGELALTFGGTVYSVGLAQAALLVAIVAVVSVVIYLVLRTVWAAPMRALFAWRDRKVEKGRAAISHGLLAIAAGDLRRAELASKEAQKRAPDAPLTALLQAQTAQLKGDRESAGKTFTAMLDSPETRIAGLHGLFVEAERQGAAEAACHYARTAYDARPDTSWAVRALLRYQAGAGDWDAALSTLASASNNRSIDKKIIRDHRAVLLTAKAMAGEDADTANARQAAMEAHQLAPDLAPAAIVAGRILSRAGEVKRAAKVLEASWKAKPHPELADAYAHVRAGDSAIDRMGRMEKLMRMTPHNDEGRMAFVAAAIEAREWEKARDTLKPVITTRPTRNALILMAELDEAEHGDRGRVREWLDRAVRAPLDPVWTADGIVLDEWAPVSPVTGRIGAVEWKLPVDEGETSLSIDMDDDAFKPHEFLPLAAAAVSAGAAGASAASDEQVEAALVDVTPGGETQSAAADPDIASSDGDGPAEAADDTPEPEAGAGAGEENNAAEPPPPDTEPLSGDAGGKDAADEIAAAAVPVNGTASVAAPEPSDESATTTGDGADKAQETGTSQHAGNAPDTDAGESGASVTDATDDGGAETEPDTKSDADTASADATSDAASDAAADAASVAEGAEDQEDGENEDELLLPRIPDDPGVEEVEEPEPRGFRLF